MPMFEHVKMVKQKNTRISVLIVGQDRGGKTSLKKHILGQDFDPDELSTDGIEVDVVELTDENAKDPWKGRETEFLKSANEVDEHILEYTAKLVTEKEQNQKSKSDAISSQSEETLPEEKLDKIDNLRNNVNSESPSTTVFLHDFAGQSIYYDTHFCFLKTACPYLLVVDVSSPLDDTAESRFKSHDSERDLHDPLLKTNLDYLLSWLTVLARLSYSGSHCWRYKLPPVVIALTNGDKCEAKYIKEVKDRIKAKVRKGTFQNVFTEQIHVIDNTSPERNNHEIRELRRHLYDLCKDILKELPLMPVGWLRLEVELGDKMLKGLKHITLEECRKVAKSCKVDDVDSALDFLHNQGIIVHHKKSQVVVLDPRWLMDLFIQIITVPKKQNRDPIDAPFIELLLKKGILMKEYLEKKVDREHQVLEELMKQFSLFCPWYYEEGSDVQEQLSKSPNAYIVPSVVPFLPHDVQKELSQSPIASVLLKFNLGYVPIGFYTRFQTTMIKKCVEEGLLTDTPQLFSNFTLLILNGSEGCFFVYLIKIPSKIKVGVVPSDESESTEQAHRKFVGNLKRFLLDCTQRVKEEEPVIYRNVTALLEVKCSCMENRQHRKRRHLASEKTTSSIGKEDPPVSENLHDHFWPLKKLQTYTEDFVYCPSGNTVKPGKFFLDRVKPWQLHPGTTLVSLFYFIQAFCDISVLILFKKIYSSCFYENFIKDIENSSPAFIVFN